MMRSIVFLLLLSVSGTAAADRPAGTWHRGVVTGSNLRRALALVLHDAARPASHLADPPGLVPCR
jgi:hypothetical protein